MSDDQKVLLEKVREFEGRKGHTIDRWPTDPNNTASVLKERRYLSAPLSAVEAKKQMFARSRRSFLTGGVAALLGILGWRWIPQETKAKLFRRTFEFNEKVSRIFFDKNDLVPEFPIELASERVNGLIGLESDLEPDKWRLLVTGINDPQKYRQYSSEMTFSVEKEAPRRLDSSPMEDVPVTGLLLSLDDIRSLPRIEMTTELKCIEGWSVIVNWTGARFSDFAARYFTG
jgi:hypothetical protein